MQITAADTPAAREAMARFISRQSCSGDYWTCQCSTCQATRRIEQAEEAWAEESMVRSFESAGHECGPGCC